MPHGLIRFGREVWTLRDRVLAVAFTLYEQSLCSCGHPMGRAHNPDMEGYYSRVTRVCQACAAREGRDEGPPQPGQKVGVVDESYDLGFEPDPRRLRAPQ